MQHSFCSARTMSYCSDWEHLIVFLVRPSLVSLSSLLSLSLSPCRSYPVFIFCLAVLLAFCLFFSAMTQPLSDIERLGCGCHTRAPKPNSVSLCVQGAEARTIKFHFSRGVAILKHCLFELPFAYRDTSTPAAVFLQCYLHLLHQLVIWSFSRMLATQMMQSKYKQKC